MLAWVADRGREQSLTTVNTFVDPHNPVRDELIQRPRYQGKAGSPLRLMPKRTASAGAEVIVRRPSRRVPRRLLPGGLTQRLRRRRL